MFYTMSTVYAAYVQKGIGYREVVSLGEEVPVDFHTTLYPRTTENAPVQVENTVQRRKSNGIYVNISQMYLSVQKLNESMHLNYRNNNGPEKIRSIWVNQTQNSFVSGDWYLDPGHM